MNRTITASLILAATLALPLLAAPTQAAASCADRKMTGTVIGGVGGALIGNSISRGGGGALIGGLGGAVIGHEIAGSGCHRERVAYGYRDRYRRVSDTQPRAVRYVYYDQYGNPVSSGPAPTYVAARQAYAGDGCQTETRSYYDERGNLVQRPVQVCAR